MGRVLLAALPEYDARDILLRTELRANTERTIVDIEQLIAEFGRVREQGYALINQELELELGLCSIAVSLRNRRGETIAALNVGAPAAHVQPEQMVDQLLPLLQDAGENIRLSLA